MVRGPLHALDHLILKTMSASREAGIIITHKATELNSLPNDHTANTQPSQTLNSCGLILEPTI